MANYVNTMYFSFLNFKSRRFDHIYTFVQNFYFLWLLSMTDSLGRSHLSFGLKDYEDNEPRRGAFPSLRSCRFPLPQREASTPGKSLRRAGPSLAALRYMISWGQARVEVVCQDMGTRKGHPRRKQVCCSLRKQLNLGSWEKRNQQYTTLYI